MKKIIVKGFGNQPDESTTEMSDFFEEQRRKKLEQVKKIISAQYDPMGSPNHREFRTTMELQYEFREIVSLSEFNINEAMNELGYQVDFIDNKPNWVLYSKNSYKDFIE